MKKKTFTLVAIAMVMLLNIGLSSCGGDSTPSAVVDSSYEWLSEEYTDSSQLTSWADLGQTKKLNLVAWNTLQEGGYKKVKSSDDVVYPEIERITGVTIDTERSFDNGGVTADVKYEQLQITGFPDIAYGSWIDPDEVYDLTDLIDQYCPTIKARMPESVWNAANINGGQEGKVYAVPYGLGNVSLSDVDPEADRSTCVMFNGVTNYYPYIYVREDILQDAYPDAYSVEDLEEIYATEGKFTEDQLFDVEITSAEQFRTEFLPKIYDAIHSDTKYQINAERWVEPLLCGYGSDRDTWDFMGLLIPWLIGATGNHINTEFTYWDAVDKEIKLLFEQDFYKAELKEWVELIQEGKYVDDYGIINNNQTLKSELNRGYYAIAYNPSTKPDGDTVTLDNGEKVSYRRVFLKIEKNEHFEFFAMEEPKPNGVCIFKDSVKESDLPQILRWLDFQVSELCDQLVAWGPETAGLFETVTNAEGKTVRQFKDADLVDQMVYSTVVVGDKVQKYNLCNGTSDSPNVVFTFFYQGGSKVHPKTVYDLSSLSDLMYNAYSPAAVCPDKVPVGIALSPEIWKWNDQILDGVEEVWGKRPAVEKALFELLRSGSNFENQWKNVEQTLNSVGWTQEYFAGDFMDAFLNENEDYLSGFYE